ncbi:hypothetical protein UPYG_G00318140 [Umbra pygmaea]|uniref:Serum deprivation-response protein n=1 Tax=Umbra pygmaea TaxID=75934 RepID=A0ABD0W0W9_UMBPY
MGEDSSHADRTSNSSSIVVNPQQYQAQQDNMDLLVPSFSPSSAPSSPTGTLSRLGLKTPGSPGPGGPASPTAKDQVSAITVVALLDKLVNMLETVQDNQQRMEQRQADLEGAVRGVQGDVTRLSKHHTSTSNSVSKLLERSRKVSANMKEVRERLDKQATQVKRLEANHGHLLKRNHFKVLIFQEDNEIPSSVFVKDTLKASQTNQLEGNTPEAPAPSIAGTDLNRSQEGLHTISLSSDDDDAGGLHEEDEVPEGDIALAESSQGLATSRPFSERSRADRLKRSSLKKVDSLKKAFSRESIEKKMSKIGTKIVPPASREKIKKSFTPNHPKNPADKSSSFKVSPMTFNVKKVRGEGETSPQAESLPSGHAQVEIPPLGSIDSDISLAEVHKQEVLVVQTIEEKASPLTPGSVKVELTVNGEAEGLEGDLTADRLPEQNGDMGEQEVEKVEQGLQENPVEVKAPVVAAAAACGTVEQAS